ncbi:anhydro-N-acetylmuramic acid kinase [Ekhidna sp.]|uniref:anhydro-N-acetylmuramic acid kinase n=1 Tax=Ekhidna sp. TaxID=2608089 RepID=UPI003B5BB231
MKRTYSIIGGMAGSSMDGLDLSHIIFEEKNNSWGFHLKKSETIPYDDVIHALLKDSSSMSTSKQHELDRQFGKWIGNKINLFKSDIDVIDFVGVHGHTVIHSPSDKISWQLGRGDIIAKEIKLPTITEFRTKDVQNGGQGAPLVPFGDFKLFPEYDACLNLGGIANLSLKENQTAWDICPCNQVLNFYAKKMGDPFDANGELAKKGEIDSEFYNLISEIDFFKQPPPKSLPNNFISSKTLESVKPFNGLRTYCQVIAEQIKASLYQTNPGKLLITGGGAFNNFLIELIKQGLNKWEIVVPESKLINFKESLIFAFLALRRFRNEINVLASVTGASKDSSSGVIHLP